MLTYLENFLAKTPAASHWQQIGTYHHHGICIMLSSLHSKKSAGIGEYLDLLPLIDFISKVNMDIIQLLPLNDSAEDPSPYNAVSAFALNPVFLSLWALPHLEKFPQLEEKISLLQKGKRLKNIRYQKTRKKKLAFLREYFTLIFPYIKKEKGYRDFINSHRWVYEYGLYLALREKYNLEPWLNWPEYKNPSESDFFQLVKEYDEEISFAACMQYLCYQQMTKVKSYAEDKKVFLMGDIPILLSADSVDCWFNQEIFYFDKRAGAPPDMYNAQGQSWGFPLFCWDQAKKNNYLWWQKRLDCAAFFYHIYRIDHVVGFFRIWGIPKGKCPKEGDFFSSNRYLWPFHGKERLKMLLNKTLMLPIAEDLGTIPKELYAILKNLGISGTKVMRWHRKWDLDGSFFLSDEYEPLSLCCISTHDSETLQQWWEKFPHEAKEFAVSRNLSYQPKLDEDLRWHLLQDAHHTSSLFHINPFQEYLALYPELRHKDPSDDRINVPGTENDKNWAFCLRPSVEELVAHDKLQDSIHCLIAKRL